MRQESRKVYVVVVDSIDGNPLGGGPSRYGEFLTLDAANNYRDSLSPRGMDSFIRVESETRGVSCSGEVLPWRKLDQKPIAKGKQAR